MKCFLLFTMIKRVLKLNVVNVNFPKKKLMIINKFLIDMSINWSHISIYHKPKEKKRK